jgi:hypothetical protein
MPEKRPPSVKRVESLLGSYKTPRKEDLETHELSVVGRPSFLNQK